MPHDLLILIQANSLLVDKNIMEICHCVFHKKCHDKLLESSDGDSFKIIVFKLMMLVGLC
jgi:hypothetical protein